MDGIDGFPADIGLVNGKGRARAAGGREQVAQPDRKRHDAVERTRGGAGSGNAVEVEPAGRQVHVDGQGVPPQRLDLARQDLRPPVLLEGEREVRQRRASRIGPYGRAQVEGRLVPARPGVAVLALGAPSCGTGRAPETGDRQAGGQLALQMWLAGQIGQAAVERVARDAVGGAQQHLEAHVAVAFGP
jgi:hypothetical protein